MRTAKKLMTVFRGGGSYGGKLRAIESANLITHWPLTELSGTNADNAEGTAARDGTYTGVTLNSAAGPVTGERAGLWDGTNDYCDVYSASLGTAFSGAAGTLAIWAKMELAIWQDNTKHGIFNIEDGSTNRIRIEKSANVDDRLTWSVSLGGTADTVVLTGNTTTAWFHIALTWDKSADAMIAYYDGVKNGATQTGIGTWDGSGLHANRCVIGATTDTPASPYNGNIAHAAIWTKALTPAQILLLATV